ncbi:hypothetical protein [Flavisericum labens]|uniref:hypothetical protein n=1 Tax=Flavisericum labens TaxID=3377112 RepID=UPI00387B85BA
MKKTISLLLCISAFLSCKNDKKAEQHEEPISIESSEKTAKQNDGLTLLKGDFIYFADAAVLQTHAEIYGVVIDETMHKLDKQVQQYKSVDTDMVPVEIRGRISAKPENEEGWPFRVEVKEILNVYKPKEKDSNVIKLGEE